MKQLHYLGWAIMILLLNTPAIVAEDSFNGFHQEDSYAQIRVQKVISADTIILENDQRIKLIGLKAPDPPRRKYEERDKNGFIVEERTSPLSSMDEQAFEFAQSLLEDKLVRVEFDAQKKDENFKTVAYVFLVENNLFVNAEILRQGFATLQIRPPNLKYADLLRAAYKEARQEKRGLQSE